MERQSYIIKMAKELLTNYTLPSRYKIKLQFYINSGKLLYVKNFNREIKTRSGKIHAKVFGTASERTKIIRITSLCWSYHHEDMRLVDYQIKHTILHEIDHILTGNSLHPGGLVAYTARITALMGGR